MKMGHYIFPVEFVFWGRNDFHEKHKAQLLPLIRNSLSATHEQSTKACPVGANTEYFDQKCSEKYIPFVTEALFPVLEKMFEEVPSLPTPHKSQIKNIWYNHYTPTGVVAHDIHGHGADGYSGIYLLELTEPNSTVFFSPSAELTRNIPSHGTFETRFAKEGDILLFPSALLHYVKPSKNPRTTVAFNIQCSFEPES